MRSRARIPSAQTVIVSSPPVDIALFVANLEGGGAERMMTRLANRFVEEGFSVDLVLASQSGAYLREVGPGVRIVDLGRRRVSAAILPLARYLRRARPIVMLSTLNHVNACAAVSRKLAGAGTRLVVRQASVFAPPGEQSLKQRLSRALLRWAYRNADAVVAISEGVRTSLIEALGLSPQDVEVVYNPAFHSSIVELGRTPPDDESIFDAGAPVVVAVGSLREQKDYPTLINAFARLRSAARLVILGEGPQREELEALVRSLDLQERVLLPGFVNNPFSYVKRARVLVLASRSEGFGNVVVEAMALGTQIIVTDCPGGPGEIVDFGRYGVIVPAGDPDSLAEALCAVLAADVVPPERLVARAEEFSVSTIASRYLETFRLRPRAAGAAGAA